MRAPLGKTELAKIIACEAVVHGQAVGWFAPDYKRLSEASREIEATMIDVKESSRQGSVFRARDGGRIDFWTLGDEHAGRSRFYNKVILDEAAFAGPKAMDIWEKSIKPTLFDFDGECFAMSNTTATTQRTSSGRFATSAGTASPSITRRRTTIRCCRSGSRASRCSTT